MLKCLPVYALLSAVISFLPTPVVAAQSSECTRATNVVGATYSIKSEQAEEATEITVLRETEGRVIYLLSTDKITRVYEHYGNDRIGVTEFYDLEAIGVEHAPAINATPWRAIYEFFPLARVSGFDKVATEPYRCLSTSQFTDNSGTTVRMLDSLTLPLLVEQSSKRGQQRWQLTELHTDRDLLDATLSRIETYQSYDFADLGDMENEAFFRNSEWLRYKLHGGDEYQHAKHDH